MNLHLQLWQDLIDLCQSLTPEQYTFECKMLNGGVYRRTFTSFL